VALILAFQNGVERHAVVLTTVRDN
jgi:hypothetical protein